MDLAIVPDKTSTIISDNSKKLNKSITSDIKKMEVVYKVQIAAIKNGTADLDSAELAKIGKLSVKKQDEMSKYMVGDYKTREEALSAREKLKSIGYQGAFLVSVFE
jgi:cell division protein FtsN